jgi:hypothetical protein
VASHACHRWWQCLLGMQTIQRMLYELGWPGQHASQSEQLAGVDHFAHTEQKHAADVLLLRRACIYASSGRKPPSSW